MRRTLLLVPFLLVAGLLLAAPFAQSASSGVVVAELYAGGGNSGATYADDYVTLLNHGSTAVDLSGWTVQYASAASTSWQSTALSGSIQPGRYYLVQLASGGTAGAALPAADATGTTNLANAGGKVALVRDSTALACGATPGSCAGSSSIADLVGYGSATDYEGSGAAAAPTNTTALARANTGCSDSGDNASDFATAPPTPKSSAAPATSCTVTTTSTTTTTTTASAAQGAAVDVQVQPVPSIATRVLEHQLRRRRRGRHARSRLGARHGALERRCRLHGRHPPHGVRSGRPPARRRARSRSADADPGLPGRGPRPHHHLGAERSRR